MKNIAIVISLALLLAACGGGSKQVLIKQTEQKVVMPPASLFECPDMPPLPEGEYTQREVADLLLQMYQRGQICKASLKAVKDYLEAAKEIVEQGKEQ